MVASGGDRRRGTRVLECQFDSVRAACIDQTWGLTMHDSHLVLGWHGEVAVFVRVGHDLQLPRPPLHVGNVRPRALRPRGAAACLALWLLLQALVLPRRAPGMVSQSRDAYMHGRRKVPRHAWPQFNPVQLNWKLSRGAHGGDAAQAFCRQNRNAPVRCCMTCCACRPATALPLPVPPRRQRQRRRWHSGRLVVTLRRVHAPHPPREKTR